MRRGRRIHLSFHSAVQEQRLMSRRWSKFSHNVMPLIKNELGIQDGRNFGAEGLNSEDLLQVAQHAFKRRQRFVRTALAQRARHAQQVGEAPEQRMDRQNSSNSLEKVKENITHLNRLAKMQRRLTRREMRRFEDMTVFARFKYS